MTDGLAPIIGNLGIDQGSGRMGRAASCNPPKSTT